MAARAGFPMYDLPMLAEVTAAWWAGLAAALGAEGIAEVPARLDRETPAPALWLAPDLLLAQTCGYPLTHALRGRVSYVATPCYAAEGCSGSAYRSRLLVRRDEPAGSLADLAGRRVACNVFDSHSGMNVLRRMVAPLAREGRFFAEVAEVGSHRAAMRAVAEGAADLCAVDCVTHALLARYAPADVAPLRVLDESPAAPGLPYITRRDASPDLLARLRAGLASAFADPGLAEVRAALLLSGLELCPPGDYEVIAEMAREAAALGYPDLC